MTASDSERKFIERARFDQPELLGARWWHEGLALAANPRDRRSALKGILGGVLGLTGFGVFASVAGKSCSSPNAELEPGFEIRKALELQQAEGWNAGGYSPTLPESDLVRRDCEGKIVDPAVLKDLALELRPKSDRLRPYYVPTLFQVLQTQGQSSLGQALRAAKTASIEEAFGKGEAVLSLFLGVEMPKDTALIVDLPGPQSVAFAAAVSGRFHPIFVFDNWPHPRGVVSSDQTLGTAAYYRPKFLAAVDDPLAPPIIVLDRWRLSPYSDDPRFFDNRYLARLPSADAMKTLGYRRVLYIAPGGRLADSMELDDLNDDFVAYRDEGIEVKLLALTDIRLASAEDLAVSKDGHVTGTDPSRTETKPTSAPHTPRGYYYHGSPFSHYQFWSHYGWYAPPTGVIGVPAIPRPMGAGFVPSRRRTLFSGSGIMPTGGSSRTIPPNFGRVRTNPSSRDSASGNNSGRNGSINRSRSSSGG